MLSVPQESQVPSRRPHKRARVDEATTTEEPDPSSMTLGDLSPADGDKSRACKKSKGLVQARCYIIPSRTVDQIADNYSSSASHARYCTKEEDS